MERNILQPDAARNLPQETDRACYGSFVRDALAAVPLDRRWSLAAGDSPAPAPGSYPTPAARPRARCRGGDERSRAFAAARRGRLGRTRRDAQGNGHQSGRQDQNPGGTLRGRQLTGRRRARASLGADLAPHHPLGLRNRSPPLPQRSRTTTAHRLVAKGCGAALRCARRAPVLRAGMGIRMQGRAWRCLRVGRRLGSSVHPRAGHLQLRNRSLGIGSPARVDSERRLAAREGRPSPARGPWRSAQAPISTITAAHIAPRSRHLAHEGARLSLLHGSGQRRAIPAPKLGATARKIALEPSRWRRFLPTIPQLASVGSQIRYFNEPDDTATVLRRGKTAQGPADLEGFTLTTSPLLWNPAPGEEVVVVLGRGAKDSFIVALYRLPDNHYKLASSLLLVNDAGPFALAYHGEVRERFLWSSCWKCTGEGRNDLAARRAARDHRPAVNSLTEPAAPRSPAPSVRARSLIVTSAPQMRAASAAQ